MVVIEDNGQSSDHDIAVVDKGLGDVVDPSAWGEFLLGEDDLFGQVQQEHVAALVAGQQVVVMLGEGTEAGHVLHVNRVLGEVLLHRALVVPVLLLLFDLVHAQVQPIKNGLLEHLANESVGLRKHVLTMVGVADAPFVEIKFVHCYKLYNKGKE